MNNKGEHNIARVLTMAAIALNVALLVALSSTSAQAQAQDFCWICVDSGDGCICNHSTNMNGYNDGGDCSCHTVIGGDRPTHCQAFGICVPTTTDPNYATDCPDGLNHKCCTNPYRCRAYCQNPNSPIAASTVQSTPSTSRPVYIDEKFNLSRQEISNMITAQEDMDVVRVNPLEHPWINSPTLVDQIAKSSPEMADIVKMKRDQLNSHFAWNDNGRTRQRGGFTPTGKSHINFQITRLKSKWTFTLTGNSKTELPPTADVLVLDGKTWTFYRAGNILANGTIE
jgi:hypothetical protein